MAVRQLRLWSVRYRRVSKAARVLVHGELVAALQRELSPEWPSATAGEDGRADSLDSVFRPISYLKHDQRDDLRAGGGAFCGWEISGDRVGDNA